MLETELKCMITEDIYNKLAAAFTWDWVKQQCNTYYADPKGELKKHGITLRVRTKDNKHKLQLKLHKNSASPLQICEESEYPIDCIPDSFSSEELLRLTGMELTAGRLGSLTTLRHSLIYCDGVEICLDKSEYLDKTDYEIEIEYTKDIPQQLLELLSDAGVEFKAASVGKCTRFMQRLNDVIHGNF